MKLVGDGKSDDTAALQRMLDAGGAVRLARGVYRITQPLVVDLDKTGVTSIIGDGVARIAMISGLHVNGVWSAPAAVSFEDCSRLNITGMTVLDSDNTNVLLKNVSHSRLSGCLIRDDRAGAMSTTLKVVGGKGNLIGDNLLGRPGEIDKGALAAP